MLRLTRTRRLRPPRQRPREPCRRPIFPLTMPQRRQLMEMRPLRRLQTQMRIRLRLLLPRRRLKEGDDPTFNGDSALKAAAEHPEVVRAQEPVPLESPNGREEK